MSWQDQRDPVLAADHDTLPPGRSSAVPLRRRSVGQVRRLRRLAFASVVGALFGP